MRSDSWWWVGMNQPWEEGEVDQNRDEQGRVGPPVGHLDARRPGSTDQASVRQQSSALAEGQGDASSSRRSKKNVVISSSKEHKYREETTQT